MEQYIKKSALVAEIERRMQELRPTNTHKMQVGGMNRDVLMWVNALTWVKDFLNTLEVKEVDLELITHWFDHIAQIADDRKTANGTVMEDWAALDEIKCLAKNSSEFINVHYKAQKGN